MNFFNRAVKNVSRKLSKSILLALTFFIIGNFVIIGLGISEAAESAKVMTRQKMRAVVSYEVDYQKFYDYVEDLPEEERDAAYKSYPYISTEELQKFTSDSRVKTYNALNTRTLYGQFEAVPVGNDRDSQGGGGMVTNENGETIEYVEPNVMVKTNAIPNMIELEEKTVTVTSGRFYNQEDFDKESKVCLISEELAALNNYRVGDLIRIDLISKQELQWYQGVTEDMMGADFEVIGIYNTKQEVDPNAENFQWMSKYENPKNAVYMPETALNELQYQLSLASWENSKTQYPDDEYYQNPENAPQKEMMGQRGNVIFLLDDPMHVDEFVQEYEQANTYEYRIFDANNDTFKKLAKPLDTLSLFANIIVWLVVINAVVIITLVTALTLKTREYEIGVLLSIGVSKMKIVAQLFLELAIIAVLGFTLAAVTGGLAAKQVGKTVLDYQIASNADDLTEEDNNYYVGGWGGAEDYFSDVSLTDMVSNYEVNISALIIAEIYIAGLGIVFISILIPSFMIMRFNPKRILMNTN